MKQNKVVVENVNTPGRTTRVTAEKYTAMHQAYLQVLPTVPPGATHAQLLDLVKPHLPEALFPGGKTSGWWMKTVQLDLEAKQQVVRTPGRPLRWHRA
ncbi:MAG: hypothetical protein AAF004_02635 [Pseudomonadota bacterium]